MPKRHVGAVGVYLLRHGSNDAWETLVHRRSEKVMFSKKMLATPGGLVDRSDCMSKDWTMDKEHGFYRAVLRELHEETGTEIESLPDENIVKLEHSKSSGQRSFLIYFNDTLLQATTDEQHEWEMIKGGVENIGESVPGEFYAWVQLSSLLARKRCNG